MDVSAGPVEFLWPSTISYLQLHAKTNSKPIQTTIKKRSLRWLGNILRMSSNRNPRITQYNPKNRLYELIKERQIDLKPPGTVEKEIKTMDLI